VVRWSGGQVVRWPGGQVARWSGGQVAQGCHFHFTPFLGKFLQECKVLQIFGHKAKHPPLLQKYRILKKVGIPTTLAALMWLVGQVVGWPGGQVVRWSGVRLSGVRLSGGQEI